MSEDRDITNPRLRKVENQTFTGQVITVDGQHFIFCKFVNCYFEYAGGEFGMESCPMHGRCGYRFTGAARRTIEFLVRLGLLPPGQYDIEIKGTLPVDAKPN